MNRSLKIALIIGGAIFVLSVGFPLLARAVWSWLSMGPWMMGGWGWFMPLLMVILWGLAIWAVVLFVRSLFHSSEPEPYPEHQNSALELLKRRYARGELSSEEYEEKRRDLA